MKYTYRTEDGVISEEAWRNLMPSKSKKQARTMAAAAHSPTFAKKVGIPQKVAKDFNKADKGTSILKKKRGKK